MGEETDNGGAKIETATAYLLQIYHLDFEGLAMNFTCESQRITCSMAWRAYRRGELQQGYIKKKGMLGRHGEVGMNIQQLSCICHTHTQLFPLILDGHHWVCHARLQSEHVFFSNC